jgi:predicted Zn-dependent peptidase
MGEIEPIESVVEKLRAVTPDDILRVARRIIQDAKPTLAVVGPDADGEDLATLFDN